MGLSRYPEITERTIATVGIDAVEGMWHVDKDTVSHSMATGAMTMRAMELAGCSEEVIALGAVAGALHDVGKFHPLIQQLMTESRGKKFTSGQADLMRTHTTRGYLSLVRRTEQTTRQRVLDTAAYTALCHHTEITEATYRQQPAYAGICHTVQLCDIAHARLLDPTRSYRVARDGMAYSPQQIGQQIISQFIDFPPAPEGYVVPIEDLVLGWVDEAQQQWELSTLD